MNIIRNTLNQGMSNLTNCTNTISVPQVIDSVTYDQYETSNPLRIQFYDNNSIKNNTLRQSVNIAQNVGAEVVSAYVNPFYLTHKIVSIPSNYKNAVNTYKNYQQNLQNK